ncbi:SDR family oxidoreductase [Microbacterium sp. ET2]|uniref:SDR family oxidoreductase n=1 Tax=Microbacterium albipurpureum TaxID=3050384 RepID=UPI00259C6B00|nr:SDR family oxidoreductase [Microbacterium sp. ET2 (Ac-2212)]WJL95619.1 SDR family oxidoreductase [Microbacterium sp. ET2 (Ac-2212)]
MSLSSPPGTALITGVGRRRSIGAGLALGLARDGWDLVLNHWDEYDERVGLERAASDPHDIAAACRAEGVAVTVIGSDLSDPDVPERLVAAASASGPLRALVMSHCESVDSSILSTDIASFDRHFAVNARATWLLIKAFAERLPQRAAGGEVAGSVIALTSDHTAHNLPYGASKGALDRIVIAAAAELGERGMRANVINPGPIDTGWMDADIRRRAREATPAGRLGTPDDIANTVRFLLSPEGSWVNGQLLKVNGGFATG